MHAGDSKRRAYLPEVLQAKPLERKPPPCRSYHLISLRQSYFTKLIG